MQLDHRPTGEPPAESDKTSVVKRSVECVPDHELMLLGVACRKEDGQKRYENVDQDRDGLELWAAERIGPVFKINFERPEREPVVPSCITFGGGYDGGEVRKAEVYIDCSTGEICKERYTNLEMWVRRESALRVIKDFTFLHSTDRLKELDAFDRQEFP